MSPRLPQPDTRPDLVVRNVADDRRATSRWSSTAGAQAAGPFDVAFIVDGVPLGSARVAGLAPQAPRSTSSCPAPRCAPGRPLEAVVDPRSEVDEANEENDSLSASC